MKVALFDIDGTLLSTGGAGRRAMQAALVAEFGTHGPPEYRYDGKTDRQIARELMRASGFDDAGIDARLPGVIDRYLTGLRGELSATPAATTAYPGVAELLAQLDGRSDVVVGLLTGNVQRGAHAKLDAAGLGTARFRVGAFGCDDERRPALPAIARARATALVGQSVPGEALVIIGDTPSDLTCGRDVGARAIGVATGSFDTAALSGYAAAAVFADLSDTAQVMAAILDA